MGAAYQIEDQYATYFLTPTIVDWVDVFTRKIYRDIIIESLDFCIRQKQLKAYGYVVMSNHLHLITRSDNGTLSDTIRDLKKFTARKILDLISKEPESRREWLLHRFEWNAAQNLRSNDNQFWTHENHAESIHSSQFFNQKLNYIHDNPVRAGIVELPEHYLYSSAGTILMKKPGLLALGNWHI